MGMLARKLLPMVLLFASGYYFAVSGLFAGFLCLLIWLTLELGYVSYQQHQLRKALTASIKFSRASALVLEILSRKSPQIFDALREAGEIISMDENFEMSWDDFCEEVDRRAGI